ncbi:MAG TPA: PBP1A family penicillin-binding protein [Candidatus Paceibacterota bacterium]|nr:PBP1A family penicillin-binding protein [Candidatus Paceibacterota bacterium]
MHKIYRFVRKHWQALLIWGAGAVFLLLGLFVLWAATLQVPDLGSIQSRKVQQSTKLYDRTGTVMLYNLNNDAQRTVVPIAEISPNIQNATVAIEDPNFYEHPGIEITAIARAILVDIFTFSASQGGSTITQQVVKNTLLTNVKSIPRKLEEWILALKLERTATKQQILELYLNQSPYGGNVYGVEQASETFFGKHASDVDVAEAAYLAAVLPAPSRYSPYGTHKDELDARKNLVLEKMLEHGYLTQDQYDAAKKEVVTFVAQRKNSIVAPHFVFYVQQYLEDKYGEDAIDHGGWTVVTSLDADLQQKAEEVVQAHAQTNETNFKATNTGMIALDPTNGQVLVMVGSRNYFDNKIGGNFNVTLAKRQPGSAFKPFVYAEAFEKGYTPDTVVFDVQTQFSTACSPTDVANDTPPCYSPDNYDGKFRGPMTLRDALAQSINVPAIKTLYLAGLSDSLALAKSLGISTLGSANQYGLTLVLGGGEVTLLDMTSAYGAFAQDGVKYPVTSILKITDANGNVIEDNTQQAGTQVLPTQVAQEINDILSDPVAKAPLGENDLLVFPGHDVAVKTGTTNDYKDAWTIGYTPNLVVGMWVGNNDNSPMVKKVSGFIVGPMWHEFVNYAINKLPVQSFTRSEVDESALKPVLQGSWQVQGSDGAYHDILYWVDKDNPQGPPPANPASDPQYRYWDIPVQNWMAHYGFSAPPAN